jgi:Pyrimidine dimer DNA glycosylase
VRLWSIHPRYLDPPGLVALWREGLLAQAVLSGRTRGYTHHPQLERFRECRNPVVAIATYLAAVAREARRRGYDFDVSRVRSERTRARLRVSDGQLRHELAHLAAKLRRRNKAWLVDDEVPEAHPMFVVEEGGIATWERVAPLTLALRACPSPRERGEGALSAAKSG